jgi:biofilm PGA synthesis N-glycosyltransferase PgaC
MTEVTALIPAHNEQDTICDAIEAVQGQVDRVIVVADNCTDDTVELARSSGAEVFETVANRAKKAGGLNQALAALLPQAGDGDYFLVTDADSRIVPGFVAEALARFAQPQVGGVGGVFHGDPGGGLVGWLQRNEYARYARDIGRKRGKARVLTGTATILPVPVLRELVDQRGHVYDEEVLTEDNELSLAIQTLGHEIASPEACAVHTEIMPSWRELWHQRIRWQRGAIENLGQYGLTRVTLPYFGQQAMMGVGLIAMSLLLYVVARSFIEEGMTFHATVLTPLVGIFIAERVVTVRKRGKRAQLGASVLILEFLFDLFLQAVLLTAATQAITKPQRNW